MKNRNYFFALFTLKNGGTTFRNTKVLKRYFDDNTDQLVVEMVVTNGYTQEMYDNHESRNVLFTPFSGNSEDYDDTIDIPSDIILWIPNTLLPEINRDERISFTVLKYDDRNEGGEVVNMCAWGFQIAEYDDENIGLDYDEMMAESDEK